MISMADGSSKILPEGTFVDSEDDVLIDLDLLRNILDESPDSTQTQSSPDEYAHKDLDLGIHNDLQSQDGFEMLRSSHGFNFQSSGPSVVYPSYNPDFTNSMFMGPSDSYVSPVKSELVSCELKNEDTSAIPSSMYICSGSLTESVPSYKGRNGDRIAQSVLQSSSTSIYPGETSSHLVAHKLDLNLLQDETEAQFRHMKGEDASYGPWMDKFDWKSEISKEMAQASLVTSGVSDQANCQIMEMPFMESDVSLTNMNSLGFDSSNVASQLGSLISGTQVDINANSRVFAYSPQNYFSSDVIQPNEVSIAIGKECQTESASSVSEFSSPGQLDIKQLNGNSESGTFSFTQHDLVTNARAEFCYNQLGVHGDGTYCAKDESSDDMAYRNLMWQSEDVNNPSSRLYACRQMNAVSSRAQFHRNDNRSFVDDVNMSFNDSNDYFPNDQPSYISSNKPSYFRCVKDVEEAKIPQLMSMVSRVSSDSTRSSSSDSKSHNDDGSDICILEDISQPPPSKQSSTFGRAIAPLQQSSSSVHHTGILRKGNDERLVFQAALQDLSQAKSEASPPDGVLAVPLLRHQRIALSWMVKKETLSLNCRGGILADDQGLGKTVSTIALILKERPQVGGDNAKVMKKEEFETVDLDDDDDEVTEVKEMKQQTALQNVSNNISVKNTNSFVQSKGRPAAGTLIVCPTSVLRQWAEELHVKVTSEANLSVLVYHGSNRTKDPCELAKYDVVLTTYSIVNMEVPKQNLGDEDEEERKKQEVDNPFLGSSYSKKRKQLPGSGKKCSKRQKGIDGEMVESNARPLAKVAWFRVVLDEAQSIKNHRTQVARACWGLRAKRRWCLSGTPIQNAIDDLFSYFRFLRCEPYSAYKSFFSEIKSPIQRNPTIGYQKLQAVLKTMMLRRTKGTLLDGNPIINLPPKVIELRKVDFTDEERDFYTRLEADSRAQFREYAVAGTVKQNYVNILLMLLRLRQACDHPLLVRGSDSSSIGKSSIEMAKKLPREKQLSLLNCLEASLAICGICNDPPEDAVVSVCGHVFCHQCISEHLSGDDNQCPTTGCRVRLNVSSVFSKATFRDLLDHPDQDSFASKSAKANGSNSKCSPYVSSKINAALEVLQSLTRSQNCTATESSVKFSDANSDKCELSLKNPSNAVKMGEKAIVFSQWTGMLDLLEGSLKHTSIQYRRLDGTMSVVARDKAVKDFNTLPEVSVMIMSLKAASLGLNMVAACRVVLLDLWWNPTTEDQAIDRAHRIGQTRQVTVLRLTVRNTVEDRILALQQKKREMVASAFGEDESGGRQTRLTVEDLNYLFMA